MKKIKLTPQREKMIRYLLDRAYPMSNTGRRAGNREFEAALHEQPDHMLSLMVESAMQEQENRQSLNRLRRGK
jgi:hypothetical protein